MEIILFKNDDLISEYQGRVYVDTIWDAFDEKGDFRSDLLWEFFRNHFDYIVKSQKNERKDVQTCMS